MVGPRFNEVWTVGSYTGLIFLGGGLDFGQNKYFIFKDKNGMFVIDRDEFFSADLHRCKTGEAPSADEVKEAYGNGYKDADEKHHWRWDKLYNHPEWEPDDSIK